jgi:23S rRNA (adenine2503-C2)-methyltransferase
VLPDIKTFTRDELLKWFADRGQPAYRADQLLRWLYERRAESWDIMSNLPAALRTQLRDSFTLDTLKKVRQQGVEGGTRKFLWQLRDSACIESVLLPANPALYGETSDRHTLCVSTQVGCAYGCAFCASGLAGWKRHLGPDEIVEQVLATERITAPKPNPGTPAATGQRLVNNLVIMGMGEPLANYDNLLKALRILNAPWGGGIGARKITISTSGLAPQIRRLSAEPEQFRLAISLHGATDPVRNRIMPVNRKHPLAELTAACEDYLKRKGRIITLEYILIAGVNDSLEQVRPLATLARRLHAKINLIPCNPVEGLEWKSPDDGHCSAFLDALQQMNISATLRQEKGGDIDAACGQLRLREERESGGGRISE